MECGACLDLLVAKDVIGETDIVDGKQMLVRIASMLCKLVERFSDPLYVREQSATYGEEACGEGDSIDDSTTRTTTRTILA